MKRLRTSGFGRRAVAGAAVLLLAGTTRPAAGEAAPVPTLHVSDLFRPHNDPDDHWDLATQYALARQGRIDLRGVMIDYPQPARTNAPDLCAVAQMNHITALAVPVVVGSPRVPAPDDMQAVGAAVDLAGVRAFLDWVRRAPRPVTIHVIGSCRDLALALRLEPGLFADRCAAIYLNAGSGTPDPERARQLEWNVHLDPASYDAVFDAPCPVYWLPCFETVSPPRQPFRVATYGSFYRFRQGDILPYLSPRVQQFFAFMFAGRRPGGDPAAPPEAGETRWLQYLSGPPDTAVLEDQAKRDRNMWCTAGFLHAAGLAVDRDGGIRSRDDTADPVFTFEPIRVSCSTEGVTTWSTDPASRTRFLLKVAEVDRYPAAMTRALKTLLTTLP